MPKYVDGFVIPIPTKNLAAYRKMAKIGAKAWLKHGALDYKECVGDDLNPKQDPNMAVLSFPAMAQAKKGETVVFSYIVFKSRAHRDRVNAKVMKEMDELYADKKDMPMPFDPKRMAYGGFSVLVDG